MAVFWVGILFVSLFFAYTVKEGGMHMDIIAMLNEYIRSELLIITPVLYVIAKAVSLSSIEDKWIPWILMGVSIALSGLYTFSVTDVSTLSNLLMAIFSTIVQGILLSGTAIFGGILGQLLKEKRIKS